MSHQYDYMSRCRARGDIRGRPREILRLLKRSLGTPVTSRLIAYHLWERRGYEVPESGVRVCVRHMSFTTGFGVRHDLTEDTYQLWPEKDESWLEPERWEEAWRWEDGERVPGARRLRD